LDSAAAGPFPFFNRTFSSNRTSPADRNGPRGVRAHQLAGICAWDLSDNRPLASGSAHLDLKRSNDYFDRTHHLTVAVVRLDGVRAAAGFPGQAA